MTLTLPVSAATLEATYLFQNSLSAQEAGAPALVANNPLSQNTFENVDVFGTNRTVLNLVGTSADANQSGLSLNTTGLVSPTSYSAEAIFEFSPGQADSVWRRVAEFQNRQAEGGLYFNATNNLSVFPQQANGDVHTGIFYDITWVANSGTALAYINGTLVDNVASTELNINNPGNTLNLFLDNLILTGGVPGEYENAKIALFRIWNGALTGQEVANIAANPFPAAGSSVPEPSTYLLVLTGIGVAAVFSRRKASVRSK